MNFQAQSLFKPMAVLLCVSLIVPCAASGQLTQTWNINDRERSQSATAAGITYIGRGQVERAINLFRQATRYDSSDPLPFAELGLALAMQGKYPESLDALQNSYSLGHQDETLLSTGIVYYLNHDYDAAINAFNKVVEANPKLCHIFGDIGFAFRLCVARMPTAAERQPLVALFEQTLMSAAGDDAARHSAAWTTLARVLLNLDETITRE